LTAGHAGPLGRKDVDSRVRLARAGVLA
jgi:hypothetical protein